MKSSGIPEYVKGETREVVVRRFEHGHPGEIGFVQIMDKDTWNMRFPDNSL
ncbi:MAG: hypothetical protein JKY11_03150 [Alphaproteobacteria bacterium]|nr:hypothetical protein [Alphaproteobacteria bacterium]